jgi:hypothetical protein
MANCGPVQNVTVGRGWETVEFHVAITSRCLGIVRGACCIHQRTLCELGKIRQILAWIGQPLNRLRVESG